MDTSGGTCYLHSDLSMWTLQFEKYTFHTPPSSRFSVARVCRATTTTTTLPPDVPSNIAQVACGETVQDAWTVDSSTYIFNNDCTVNPRKCALDRKAWDKQATGLIKMTQNGGSCVTQCEADAACTAVMMDTSGGTCYLHSDLSMWTLQFEKYAFQSILCCPCVSCNQVIKPLLQRTDKEACTRMVHQDYPNNHKHCRLCHRFLHQIDGVKCVTAQGFYFSGLTDMVP